MNFADDLERVAGVINEIDIECLPPMLNETATYLRLLERVTSRVKRWFSGEDKHGEFTREALKELESFLTSHEQSLKCIQKPIADRVESAFKSDNVIALPGRMDSCL